MIDERRRCRCHGEPMDRAGKGWQCAVVRRARRLAQYYADPASANYTRVRLHQRARIARKRRLLKVMEERRA